MRQYNQMKAKYPDTVLLFRLGDFYETFGEDAVLTAKACGITLTKRNNGGDETPLAGFPYHQLDAYLPKLVRGGHRVAVCEQVEDPKTAKGIVRRDVVEVVTPGVVLYDKLLEHTSHTYLASIVAPPKGSTLCGIAITDVSTGTFLAGEVEETSLTVVLESFAPAELILNKSERWWYDGILERIAVAPSKTLLEPWMFDIEFTTNLLLQHFATQNLKGFGIDAMPAAIRAAGVVLHYVTETQKRAVHQITSVKVLTTQNTMMLDAATRRNLEIHTSLNGVQRNGALTAIIDHTITAMGARLMRWWLQSPLLHLESIQQRLSVVRSFVASPSLLTSVRTTLERISDVERLITKVMTRRATPRDMGSIRNSLRVLPDLREQLLQSNEPVLQQLAQQIVLFEELTGYLEGALVDDPGIQIGQGNIFRPGFSEELDTIVDARTNGKSWISNYQEQERTATGIPSLKIGYTSVFGYYIEISNTHKSKVPESYHRKQTLASAERYTTPELQRLEQTLLSAEEQLSTLESKLVEILRDRIGQHCAQIQQAAAHVAAVDAYASFAQAAIQYKYVEPTVHTGTELIIEGARHPVIERVLPAGVTYVSNSVHMDTEHSQIHIITGPNMSGKSSYLRQVGLIVFLAHIGSFVPAESAQIPLTDRIFTRVGAQDNILAGESTFLVEMQESANIIHNATKRSLILLDEVGRGTATFDGISIAWAIAEYLHEVVGAKTLFATHYHELTALSKQFARITNKRVDVREVGSELVFTHKVLNGTSDHSFGIHVARMAGLPAPLLATAQAVLQQLEQSNHSNLTAVEQTPSHSELQMQLFEVKDDALRASIKAINLNEVTPLQAMQLLAGLQEKHT